MSRPLTTQVEVATLSQEPVFKPIFGKIVIEIDMNPERKYGKIVLPQSSRERTSIGKIYAVYETEKDADGNDIGPRVKIGDTVIFGMFTGTTMSIGNKTFIICKEHDLLTIVEFPGSVPIVEEVV